MLTGEPTYDLCDERYSRLLSRVPRNAGKISFSNADRLYIIGDVVDRGPDVVPLLEDIMARRNVRLLAGNHEYVGLRVLGEICKKGGLTTPLDDLSAAALEGCLLWMKDGGSQTLRQGGDGHIFRPNNHIAFDCGCVYGYQLGACCLETGEEFYVEAKRAY